MATIDKIRLSGQTYDIIDATAIHSLDGYATTGYVQSATSALAESFEEVISAKTDQSAFTAFTSATETALGNKADKSEIPAVSGYADAVAYDSGTTTMNFYHGGTGGTVVYSFDASPFLIDGMIDDVRIETLSGTSYLVIDFNTASGKQDIYIPLTDIFDPSNYYTKTETDSAISAATEGKQNTLTPGDGIQISGDVISVTGAPLTMDDHLDSGSTNPVMNSAITVAIDAKQATLVSGTNIKTVGTESVLGSGNIKLMTASIGTGNDSTTLIFDFN